jgi:hypothetical protein
MELLGDFGQIQAHFGPFGDSHARLGHGLRRTCNRFRNHFGRTRRNFLVMWVKWKHASIRLEIVLIWPNIGAWFAPNVPWAWKTFWPRPMDLLGGVGQMESCFGTFGDIVNLGAR